MRRIVGKGRIALILLSLFLVYWGLLPLVVPLPEFEQDIPAQTPVDEDVTIRLDFESWLPNYEVINVRFYVDHYKSDVHGPNGPFYPQLIHQAGSPAKWTFWEVNRFARPRRRTLEMTLPLEKLFQEGVVKPGTVRGKMDVTLAYPDLNSEMAQLLGGFPTRSRMISRPFEIDFLPADSPPG